MDISEGNAGVRPSGSKAAPSAVEQAVDERCREFCSQALRDVRYATFLAPCVDVEAFLDIADKALNAAIRKMREG